MKYLKAIGIILGVSFVGELLNHWIDLPVPASVYGIIILLILLCLRLVKADTVRPVANFLIELMPVMFVPAIVSLVNCYDTLLAYIVPFLIVFAVSTVLTMLTTGTSAQWVIRQARRREDGRL